MRNIFLLLLLFITICGCNCKKEINKIEMVAYRWGFYPYPVDRNSKLTLKLGTYCIINTNAECQTLFIDFNKTKYYNKFVLDKELFNRLLTRLDEINVDSIKHSQLNCFNNIDCFSMYDGPSLKFIIHRGNQTQTITFSTNPEDLFYEVYESVSKLGDSTINFMNSASLISRRAEVYKLIFDNTEFIVPPPPPPEEDIDKFQSPVIIDTSKY